MTGICNIPLLEWTADDVMLADRYAGWALHYAISGFADAAERMRDAADVCYVRAERIAARYTRESAEKDGRDVRG
jgi:hypothetical protein